MSASDGASELRERLALADSLSEHEVRRALAFLAGRQPETFDCVIAAARDTPGGPS